MSPPENYCAADDISVGEVNLDDLKDSPPLPPVELLEDFIRLGRLGRFADAKKFFQENLWIHTEIFSVVAEYTDFLLAQNSYGDLTAFLSLASEQAQNNENEESQHTNFQNSTEILGEFKANEFQYLRMIYSLGKLHVEGSLKQTLSTVRQAKEALIRENTPHIEQKTSLLAMQQSQDYSDHTANENHIPGDVEIQILIKGLKVAIFAATNSDLVSWEDFRLPWVKDNSRQDIWKSLKSWCLSLIKQKRYWEAAAVLEVLLQAHFNKKSLFNLKLGTEKSSFTEELELFTDGEDFFVQLIEELGDCRLDEVKLFARFEARQVYCTLLVYDEQFNEAAQHLDLMKQDIDLLPLPSQFYGPTMLGKDQEMIYSRQYLQWAILQNTLISRCTGLKTMAMAPQLETLLPIAEQLSDYPMQCLVLQTLAEENRTQIRVEDSKIHSTSFLRYVRHIEAILKNKAQDLIQYWKLICLEFYVINGLSDAKGKKSLGEAIFLENCQNVLKQLREIHDSFDVPSIIHQTTRILGEKANCVEGLPFQYAKKNNVKELGTSSAVHILNPVEEPKPESTITPKKETPNVGTTNVEIPNVKTSNMDAVHVETTQVSRHQTTSNIVVRTDFEALGQTIAALDEVQGFLRTSPKQLQSITYFNVRRIFEELKYSIDMIRVTHIDEVPESASQKAKQAAELINENITEGASQVSEGLNIVRNEKANVVVSKEILQDLFQKAILVVDYIRRSTSLLNAYRDALGKNREIRMMERREDLKTLIALSTALESLIPNTEWF